MTPDQLYDAIVAATGNKREAGRARSSRVIAEMRRNTGSE